jgi:pimeloyl-ACP methyl ester carboxylesterase
MSAAPVLPLTNSTNVRFVKQPHDSARAIDVRAVVPAPAKPPRGEAPLWLRVGMPAASVLAPPIAVRWAEHLFLSPPRMRPLSLPIFETGHRFYLAAAGQSIAAWSWGDGPTALLMHGWAGRSEQLAAFVPPLLAKGFSVIAPDAPGHGASSGHRSSLLAFADALEAVAVRVGPIEAFVGHSAGAAAGALAMHRGVKIGRAVFLAPAASLADVVVRFAWQLRIPPWIAQPMRRRIESRLGVPLSALDVARIARGARTPLLVFHDPTDREVPWKDGAAIAQAWPGARLVDVPGAGHNRILRDARVVAEASAFLAPSR